MVTAVAEYLSSGPSFSGKVNASRRLAAAPASFKSSAAHGAGGKASAALIGLRARGVP